MKPVNRPKRVKDFVQKTLGCGCPEAVFASMLTDIILLDGYPSIPVTRLLIGDRLLVYCAAPDFHDRPEIVLPELVASGLRDRNEHGYNRIRLVIFSQQPHLDATSLQTQFHTLKGSDDRLHLHVLDRHDPSVVAAGLVKAPS